MHSLKLETLPVWFGELEGASGPALVFVCLFIYGLMYHRPAGVVRLASEEDSVDLLASG